MLQKSQTGLLNLLAGNFDNVGKICESFLNQWCGPLLGVLGYDAVILAVFAGIKFMLANQSGEEQKIKQAKEFIKSIIIGIVIVFILAGIVPVIISCFQSWYDNDAQEYLSIISYIV